MTSNRNFFTYLCYILFIICTLLLLGRCFGIPEPSDYIKIASGAGVVIVTAVICILLCLLCAVLIHKIRKGRFVAEVIITILIFAAVAAIKIYTYT